MSDIKVRLMFTLVGRTVGSLTKKAKILFSQEGEWTNSDTLQHVKSSVEQHFGRRPIYVVNENKLLAGSYPKFYCAGWFYSDNTNTELVIVDHGSDMKTARENMMRSITSKVDWTSCSENV